MTTNLTLNGHGVKLGLNLPSKGVVIGGGQYGSGSIGTYYAGTNFVIGAGVKASVADYRWAPVYDYGGIRAGSPVTITNFGVVNFDTGLVGATFLFQNGGTLFNFGTINGGDLGAFLGNGHVVNGSPTDTTAKMTGGVADGQDDLARLNGVTNFGTINGIVAMGAGEVVNGSTDVTSALIAGAGGVTGNPGIEGTAAGIGVMNFGTISGSLNGGVALLGKFDITNGAVGVYGARISGFTYGASSDGGTITNFGTIIGRNQDGADSPGGTIINGSPTNTAARIVGGSDGVGAALMQNYGTIAVTGLRGMGSRTGAVLRNGTSFSTAALITAVYRGAYGNASITNFGRIIATGTGAGGSGRAIGVDSIYGVLNNFGTISATAGTQSWGVLASHAPITNFAGGVIEGRENGVYDVSGGLTNHGVIIGTGTASNGVEMVSDTLTNASDGTIGGAKYGVYVRSGNQLTSVANYGLIKGATGFSFGGSFGAYGLFLTNGGTITGTGGVAAWVGREAYLTLLPGATFNGSVVSEGGRFSSQLILGGDAATGTLSGLGTKFQNFSGLTVDPAAAWQLTGKNVIAALNDNGTLAVTGSVSTSSGVEVSGTLVNAGTISNASGTVGTAVTFGDGSTRLVVDPGAKFIGSVTGGGGTNVMELAAGATAGSIGSVGSIGAQFTGFGSLVVDAGAIWKITGSDAIGTLTDNGSLTIAGSVDVSASIAPLSTGTLALGAIATLEVASVLGTGPAIQFLANDKLIVDAAREFGVHVGDTGYIGPLLENFASGDAIDLSSLADSGLVLNYATASGLLTISKQNGVGVASLLFQTSSLGPGSFHLVSDGAGGTLITHG